MSRDPNATYTGVGFDAQDPADKYDWVTDLILRARQYTDPAYLIPDVLPAQAFTLAVGAPKVGKTAMALPLALQLARAGHKVWYILLDDSLRRMRERSMMAFPMATEEHGNLTYLSGWSPRSSLEAFGYLGTWLGAARAKNVGPSLVIVDTYGRFVGKKPPGDIFGYDYETGQAFKTLCAEHHCSILVNHHTKKGAKRGDDGDWLEMVSGTQGIAAAADCIWYIERTRGTRNGLWRITGNDMPELALPMILGNDMVWKEDLSLTPAQAVHSGTPRLVLDYLGEHGPSPIERLRDGISVDPNTLHVALTRLRDEQLVRFMESNWALVDCDDNKRPREGRLARIELAAPNAGGPAPAPGGPVVQPAPEPARDGGRRATGWQREPSGSLVYQTAPARPDGGFVLDDREYSPDDPKRGAIKASMGLLKGSIQRSGARYRPSLFAEQPAEPEPVWEGRVKYRPAIEPGTRILRLDKNAAYLSSANTLLPIGQLKRDDDPEAAYSKRQAGYHLVNPPATELVKLGGPFSGREESGEVWIPTPWVKALREITELPILASYTAPATEVMLRDWITVLRDERAHALALGDMARYAWIKSAYSLVVSTLGDSSANFEVRRKDWQRIWRSQAYANLWRDARKLAAAGWTVLRIGNTDEIWILDLLPQDIDAEAGLHLVGVLPFPLRLGAGLGEYKIKDRWVYAPGDR